MKPDRMTFLVDLNRQFYQSCAQSFSKTRQRIQPGVMRIIKQYLSKDNPSSIIDLGCGNGELARVVAEGGYPARYLGIDFSLPLMDSRDELPSADGFTHQFLEADLISPEWEQLFPEDRFSHIFSFAVLHHFPGESSRVRFLEAVHRLLKPDGIFAFSVWQFMNSPRLVKRIQPWDAVHLTPEDVDTNDYLLDWRAENETHPFRYVHHYSLEELSELREKTGFRLVERFASDGHTGNLGEYQVWKK